MDKDLEVGVGMAVVDYDPNGDHLFDLEIEDRAKSPRALAKSGVDLSDDQLSKELGNLASIIATAQSAAEILLREFVKRERLKQIPDGSLVQA